MFKQRKVLQKYFLHISTGHPLLLLLEAIFYAANAWEIDINSSVIVRTLMSFGHPIKKELQETLAWELITECGEKTKTVCSWRTDFCSSTYAAEIGEIKTHLLS